MFPENDRLRVLRFFLYWSLSATSRLTTLYWRPCTFRIHPYGLAALRSRLLASGSPLVLSVSDGFILRASSPSRLIGPGSSRSSPSPNTEFRSNPSGTENVFIHARESNTRSFRVRVLTYCHAVRPYFCAARVTRTSTSGRFKPSPPPSPAPPLPAWSGASGFPSPRDTR